MKMLVRKYGAVISGLVALVMLAVCGGMACLQIPVPEALRYPLLFAVGSFFGTVAYK